MFFLHPLTMRIYPNAKINIGLNVTERRPDGYHNIETIFYPIGLYDVLSIEPSESAADYSFSSSGIEIKGNPEDNLIIKAYRLLRTEYQFPPIDISLLKQIPFGAGLGGGSADAAFTLKAINELFDLHISTKELEYFAAKLGADCPFFIQNKPTFATGIGNIFTPVNLSLQGYWLLLVKPDIHISTAEAYAGVTPKVPEIKLSELIKRPIGEWKNLIFNDFEPSIFHKHPKIALIKRELYEMGALYASMSGSGSSVYGIFKKAPNYKGKFVDCFTFLGKMQ